MKINKKLVEIADKTLNNEIELLNWKYNSLMAKLKKC